MSKKAVRLLLLAVLGLTACGAPLAEGDGDNPPPNPKWFVCKYETTPDGVERLQTGQNPISVSENAFPAGVTPAIGVQFNDAQGRSIIIAEDVGQPEPSPDKCPPPGGGTTTTTTSTTSTTTTTTSSTTTTTTTEPPVLNPLLGANTFAFCGDDNLPLISITFGIRPDLNGDSGILDFSDGTSFGVLVFQSGQTITFPYPASLMTPLTLTYRVMGETATATVTLPEDCPPATTTTTGVPTSTTTTTPPTSTTTTSLPPTSTSSTTTVPGVTTTTAPGAPGATTTTTTTPPPFTFGAAATVCVAEVPTIRIVFQNTFPQLAGVTGILTMADIDGNTVSTQSLVYQPNTTVNLLYPGTRVNADGTIADVPGWNLNSAGLWVRDPSDEFLRAGINLTYTVNPTATAFVTYPPESANCANPDGPFPPGTTPPDLPPTGGNPWEPGAIAALILAAGTVLVLITRSKVHDA